MGRIAVVFLRRGIARTNSLLILLMIYKYILELIDVIDVNPGC